jgi:hypothetical protein
MSERVAMTSQLVRAVKDSRLLLTYAAHSGLDLDEEMLDILVNAQYRIDSKEWTNENEAAFWQAFSTLNALIKPVTLRSLKAVSLGVTGTLGLQFLRFFNKAYRTAGVYAVLSLVIMVALLFVQMDWLLGEKLSQHLTSVTDQIQQIQQLSGFEEGKFTREYNLLQIELETTRETLVMWSQPWSFALTAVEDTFLQSFGEREELGLEIVALQNKLKDSTARLRAFKDFQFDDIGRELNAVYQAKVDQLTEDLIQQQTLYEQKQDEALFVETELRTYYVLHVLQRYLLPLLYGSLGAAAYVLRSLIIAIHEETYTGSLNAKYRMRLFLGALCGLLIGFFIIPKEMSGLATLPPMALSFLAGYNIEVLFLAMDHFITAIIAKIKRRELKGTNAEE